jgi:hypothetical protein
MNKVDKWLTLHEEDKVKDADKMFLECIVDLNERLDSIEPNNRDYNHKGFVLGVASGITGLGLQNLNPFEPIAITHFNSIILGFFVFTIALFVIPMIKFVIKKSKLGFYDNLIKANPKGDER